MATTIRLFDFEIQKPHDKDPMPFDPRVLFTLHHWTTVASIPNVPILSADLVTEKEIDDHVDAMKQDLDAMAASAKRALKGARKKKK